MKRSYLAAAAVIVLLPLLVCGAAGAATVDAKVKELYWNPGVLGYPDGGSCARTQGEILFTVPASSGRWFYAPLSVPVSIGSKPCSVTRIHLNLHAPVVVNVESLGVWSGHWMIAGQSIDEGGTGSIQMITTELNHSYKIPKGLMAGFFFRNYAGTDQTVTVYAYGATIRHK